MKDILLIGKKGAGAEHLCEELRKKGFSIFLIESIRAGEIREQGTRASLILLESSVKESIVEDLRKVGCAAPVVVIAGRVSLRSIDRASRSGACDYILKEKAIEIIPEILRERDFQPREMKSHAG